MPKINGNEIRPGNVLEHNDGLWAAVKVDHVKPGKGGAFAQVEMKNLRNGSKLNERFRSADKVERVRLEQKDMQFLYEADGILTFMDTETYDQVELPAEITPRALPAFDTDELSSFVETFTRQVLDAESLRELNGTVRRSADGTVTETIAPEDFMERAMRGLAPFGPEQCSGDDDQANAGGLEPRSTTPTTARQITDGTGWPHRAVGLIAMFDNAGDFMGHCSGALIGPNTAGFLVEPIQGEGGIRPASEGFMQGLRALADEHDLMLVLDEVQCGVARTGTFYAYEQYGIEPDILATAKGIGGGFPLGACIATAKAARGMTFGTHGSTYGGNPLAMAAGMAVMKAVANEEFLASVREKGERLRARLEQFIGNYPDMFELVRGRGLMLGLKMKFESRPFYVHLRDHHQLLTVAAGDNTIRILPPLVIGDAEIEEFFDKLSAGAASFKIPEAA